MGENAESAPALNEFQARSLSVTCQYIDKMIGEIEHVLSFSACKAAFPKFIKDVTPTQGRTIEDYLARIRAQLTRVLDGQGIPRPEPTIPVSRAVSTALLTIDIAVEELRPSYMRGYGALAPELVTELEGICGELRVLVSRVNQSLAQGSGQDLRMRLERWERTSAELELLAKIERIVSQRGLVEFRSTLATIADRLEDQSLEIAVFGRVSSGKSSLLNAVLDEGILPVGVTPITAVPTRLRYDAARLLTVWYAERPTETMEVSRLAEFASEKGNPNNQKRVTRMVVHLPASRLREGVMLVDTPGLGSLATTGAAETLAYLPSCDLGIVLIDAGSTLTQEDLQTIQALYRAGIPVQILLSKADLLSLDDVERVVSYVKENISREYGIDLPVHPVSAIPERRSTLDAWFTANILPLYARCRELKNASLCRKIGALRDAVVAALTLQLRRSRGMSGTDREKIRQVEANLRKATGRIVETRNQLERDIDALGRATDVLLDRGVTRLANAWSEKEPAGTDLVVYESLVADVHEQTKLYHRELESLARDLQAELARAASALGMPNGPSEEEFVSVIRGMPVFDFAPARELRPSSPSWQRMLRKAGLRMTARRAVYPRLEKGLSETLSIYAGVLGQWASTVVQVIEKQFASFADGYRAQAERAQSESKVGGPDQNEVVADLRTLGETLDQASLSVGSAS